MYMGLRMRLLGQSKTKSKRYIAEGYQNEVTRAENCGKNCEYQIRARGRRLANLTTRAGGVHVFGGRFDAQT
jgi:hypothetical protein